MAAAYQFYPGEIQDDRYPIRYKVNDDGTISTLQSPPIGDRNQKRINIDNYNRQSGGFPFTNIADAQNEVARKQQANIKNLQDTYEKRLSEAQQLQIQISQPNMATYASDFAQDLLKDPTAPTFNKALDREKFRSEERRVGKECC